MRRIRWKPIIGIIAVVTTIGILCILPHERERVIWQCPPNEKIVYIKTADIPCKLYVITQKDTNWVLRAIYDSNKATILAEGQGRLQIMNTIVPGHNRYDYLIGLFDNDGNPILYTLNTSTKKGSRVQGVTRARTYNLMQPYSPDNNWLAVYGRDKFGKNPMIRMIDRRTGKTNILMGIKENHPSQVTWTRNNRLVVIGCHNGDLYQGDATGVKIIRRFEPASMGFLAPDGNDLITAQRFTDEGVVLKHYDLNDLTDKQIYRGESGFGDLMEFQYAPYCNEITLSTWSWQGANSIFIDSQRNCKEIKLAADKSINSMCGLAIWSQGMIAVVNRHQADGADKITIIRVQ